MVRFKIMAAQFGIGVLGCAIGFFVRETLAPVAATATHFDKLLDYFMRVWPVYLAWLLAAEFCMLLVMSLMMQYRNTRLNAEK